MMVAMRAMICRGIENIMAFHAPLAQHVGWPKVRAAALIGIGRGASSVCGIMMARHLEIILKRRK